MRRTATSVYKNALLGEKFMAQQAGFYQGTMSSGFR